MRYAIGLNFRVLVMQRQNSPRVLARCCPPQSAAGQFDQVLVHPPQTSVARLGLRRPFWLDRVLQEEPGHPRVRHPGRPVHSSRASGFHTGGIHVGQPSFVFLQPLQTGGVGIWLV